MMDTTISDQAALRVALASKSLPNIDLRSLLGLLIQHLGEPLTETKLVGLSPKAFRLMVSSLGSGPTRKDVSSALDVLCNPEVSDVSAPQVPAQEPIAGPKLKVALTSNQGEMVNGHYGSCLRVLIYEVSAIEHQLVEVREMPTEKKGEQRAIAMLDRVRDCHMLFTLSIGGPAAARVTRANIHPIKKLTPMSAEEVLSDLSNVIATNPPPWIKRILGIATSEKILEEESYE
ncbi:NifB/NifX family molybdenum-iron cluster-binding protein [Vibrio sp. YIC-376]|uniref:NifB/NifX family molybdenum-iron cluster-binding protein n=1 Tax=Vibrio sp. YIC-376 TaxID=3136162 RepID=UPI00402A9FE3